MITCKVNKQISLLGCSCWLYAFFYLLVCLLQRSMACCFGRLEEQESYPLQPGTWFSHCCGCFLLNLSFPCQPWVARASQTLIHSLAFHGTCKVKVYRLFTDDEWHLISSQHTEGQIQKPSAAFGVKFYRTYSPYPSL